jgi:membrane-associated phospholipid phosphatase
MGENGDSRRSDAFGVRTGILMIVCIVLSLQMKLYGQEETDKSSAIPFTDIFYHLDDHLVGSFTDNYGMNHVLAISSSYALVEGGVDWKWNTYANNHGISKAGFVSVMVGGIVPIAAPLGLYIYGRSAEDQKLQITGLALGQAAMLSVGISSAYKAFTGRRPPNGRNLARGPYDYSEDFKFGFLNRGVYNGWPSSHTMNAFAMATTLTELYPDNSTLKYLAFGYASIIGLGVSTNIHWFSDAVAGALIGYSIGKTVGTGFRQLNSGDKQDPSLRLSIIPGGISLTYLF